MFLTIFIFFITFSNIEGRGRNFCKFQSTTQCPLGSKYIEIVIPTNNTCPDANFIYFPGGFGQFLFGRKDFDEPGKVAERMVNVGTLPLLKWGHFERTKHIFKIWPNS